MKEQHRLFEANSEKGYKGGSPHRDARKRARKVEDEKKEKRKRGISKEQVSIVVAYDRNDNIICQMERHCRIKAEEIDNYLDLQTSELYDRRKVENRCIKRR